MAATEKTSSLRSTTLLGRLACIIWTLILCFTLCTTVVNATALSHQHQRFRFETISMEELELEGDLIGAIHSITQDNRGFMWFGGDNGLVRYNGNEFRLYQTDEDNHQSLTNNDIKDMIVDKDGVFWVATRKGLNRYNEKDDNFTRYLAATENNQSLTLSSDHITSLAVDKNNTLYAGTANGLTVIPSDRKSSYFCYSETNDKQQPNINHIVKVVVDRRDRVLIGTFVQGLQILNKDRKYFEPFPIRPEYQKLMVNRLVSGILFDHRDRLWLSSITGGLLRIERNGDIHQFQTNDPNTNQVNLNSAWDIFEDTEGNIWLITDSTGLGIYNEQEETFTTLSHNSSDRFAIASNQIRSLYQDRSGDIWAGTFTSGISYHDQTKEPFRVYYNRQNDNTLSNDGILAITQTKAGIIWIGTEKGLNRFDPIENSFKVYNSINTHGALFSDAILSIEEDPNGLLWLGTTRGGLHSFDPTTEEFIRFGKSSKDGSFTSENYLWKVLYQDNSLWAGSLFVGLIRYDLNGNKIEQYKMGAGDKALPSNFVSHLLIDTHNNLWIGTLDGLVKRDYQTKVIHSILVKKDNNKEQNDNRITALHQDVYQRIWVGVHGRGISVFNEKEKLLKTISTEEGLLSAMINSIVSDSEGDIWVSTQNGIARIDRNTFHIQNFQQQNGLASNNHNRDATLADTDGNLYFGSSGGLTIIDPKLIKAQPRKSQITFTELTVNGVEIAPDNPRQDILTAPMLMTNDITLSFKQSSFGFSYALLNYRGSRYNRYSYKLEGFDHDWSVPARATHASYTNIPAGSYLFKVRGKDSNNQWSANEATVKVTVLPPPWKTLWAYGLYLTVFASIVLFSFNHKRKRMELEKEKAINSELIKVAQLKNTFLANTSHELRTPLNGIIGISEYLKDYSTDLGDQHLVKHLKTLSNSGKRLLNLVNDVLDFSKLDNNSLKLKMEPVNILQQANDAIAVTLPEFANKDLIVENKLDPYSPLVMADPNRIQQVILNILGNALKYTECGTITLFNQFDNETMTVSIRDSGSGIAQSDLQAVFGVFNQQAAEYGEEKGGIGLGLAIAKQIINLHGGTIQVNSVIGEGSTFSFDLPLAKPGAIFERRHVRQPTQPIATETIQTSAKQAPSNTISTLPKILVVDDDAINRMVMTSLLQDSYRIIEAENGQQAVDLINDNEKFDLVLLDIMMPKLNGFEACKLIRMKLGKDVLPIIFVTARNVEEDLAVGFAAGGNDFIEKPISKHKLLPRLTRLLTKSLSH